MVDQGREDPAAAHGRGRHHESSGSVLFTCGEGIAGQQEVENLIRVRAGQGIFMQFLCNALELQRPRQDAFDGQTLTDTGQHGIHDVVQIVIQPGALHHIHILIQGDVLLFAPAADGRHGGMGIDLRRIRCRDAVDFQFPAANGDKLHRFQLFAILQSRDVHCVRMYRRALQVECHLCGRTQGADEDVIRQVSLSRQRQRSLEPHLPGIRLRMAVFHIQGRVHGTQSMGTGRPRSLLENFLDTVHTLSVAFLFSRDWIQLSGRCDMVTGHLQMMSNVTRGERMQQDAAGNRSCR